MARIRIARSNSEKLEEATQEIFNGEFLLNAETENLYIKNKDKLVLVGGTGKQNKFEQGDNLEIKDNDINDSNSTQTIRLKDDIVINTCTLSPSKDVYDWKGCVKIGELKDHNQLFIITKYTPVKEMSSKKAILGGEVIVKLIRDDGTFEYAHSAISVSSTGSWALKGASNAENNLRMCELTQIATNETFYGLKIPLGTGTEMIEQVEYYEEEEEYTEIEKYTVDVTKEKGIETPLYIGLLDSGDKRPQTAYQRLGIYSPSAQKVVTLTYSNVWLKSYNYWLYCSFKDFVDLRYPSYDLIPSELKDLYDKNLYIYFWVYYRYSNSTRTISTRVYRVALTTVSGNVNPYGETGELYYDIKDFNQEWIEWSSYMVTNLTYFDLTSSNNFMGQLGSLIILQSYTTQEEREREVKKTRVVTKSRTILVPGLSGIIKFRRAEFWFNGWNNVPEALQLKDYKDSDFNYVVLSDVSNDNDSYAETFYLDASEVAAKLRVLPETGEDNAPYKLIVSGTLSLTDLQEIASLCRDAMTQIYLDLSDANVDSTARAWRSLIFEGCVSLRGLKIPSGVVSIEQCAFIWCTYLRDLDLTPSESTLVDIGFKDNYSENIGLFTSTRIKNLMIPSKVTHLWKYVVGSSNLRNLIFLHSGNNPISVEQWTFVMNSVIQKGDRSLPTSFHMFVSSSWYNNYLKNTYWSGPNWTWRNTGGWWTPEIVDSLVVFDPAWSQENWQSFNDIYHWGEDYINEVRTRFGYPSRVEIKEK